MSALILRVASSFIFLAQQRLSSRILGRILFDFHNAEPNMIDACTRLVKKYPYQFLGSFGIVLMAVPIILADNLKMLGGAVPYLGRALAPMFRSEWFPAAFTAVELTGVTIIFFSIYMANRSSPR